MKKIIISGITSFVLAFFFSFLLIHFFDTNNKPNKPNKSVVKPIEQTVYSDIIDVKSIKPLLPTAASDIMTMGNGWIQYKVYIDSKRYIMMQKVPDGNPILIREVEVF